MERNDVLEINREIPWDIKENWQTKLWHFVIQRVLHFVLLEEWSFYWNERLVYSAVQIFKKEGELIVGEEEEKEEKKEEEESLGTYRNSKDLVKDFHGRKNKLLVDENAKRICSGLETRFLLVRNGFEWSNVDQNSNLQEPFRRYFSSKISKKRQQNYMLFQMRNIWILDMIAYAYTL